MILIDDDELGAYERLCEAAHNIEMLMDEEVIGISTSESALDRVTDDIVEFKQAVEAYRIFKSNAENN